jgi:hypothetical protein
MGMKQKKFDFIFFYLFYFKVILRKTKLSESFGFNIQDEGIVTDVDMNAVYF